MIPTPTEASDMTYDMRTGRYHKSNRASAIAALGNLKRGDKRIATAMQEEYEWYVATVNLWIYHRSTPVPHFRIPSAKVST